MVVEGSSGNRKVWGTADRKVGVLLGLLAVAVRLVYLADSADDPSFMLPLIDSWTYHDLAAGLVERGVFDEKFLWQAVFYPAFLAGVYAVCGVSVLAATLVQTVLAGVTGFMTHRLGYRLFGGAPAVAAGLIYALYGPLVFFETRLLATGWTAFFTVALALILVSVDRAPGWRNFLGLGLVGGLAIFTRPTFLPVVLVLLVWSAFKAGRDAGSVARGGWLLGVAVAGALLVLGPVGFSLRAHTGHAGIVPPSGGINLYIGNNPDYENTINIRPGIRWDALVAEPTRHGYEPGPWHGQAYFRGRVWDFAQGTPGAQVGLWARKTLQLASSRELPRNQDLYLHRQWSPLLGALVFKAGPWGFPWGLVFPLAVLGVVGAWRRIPASVLILAAMLGAALVLVFISARYRSPLVPLVAVFAGQGLVWGFQRVKSGVRADLVRMAVVLAACLLATSQPEPFAQEKADLGGELHFALGHHYYRHEDWPVAAEHLRQSVILDPHAAAPRNFLGITLARLGDWEAACAQFDTALIIAPGYGEARRNLERCRRARNRD